MTTEKNRKLQYDEQTRKLIIQRRFENIKHTIRKAEGLLEIIVLTLVYYYIWKACYRGQLFPYYGNGKFVLAGIYALLLLVLLIYCDGFKYGYMKVMDVLISQWISNYV